MSKKKEILAGHKRHGKKFIPPIIHGTNLKEMNWVNDALPEIFWIGLLYKELGFSKSHDLLIDFQKFFLSVSSLKETVPFISTYGKLKSEEKLQLHAKFKEHANYLHFLIALEDLNAFYPNHPLNFLFKDHKKQKAPNLTNIKDVLTEFYERRNKAPMFAQSAIIFNELINKRLNITRNSSLADFEEIEKYPDTDLSRRVGSSIRAMINMYCNPQLKGESDWPQKFWQHSYDLEPAKISLL